MKACVTFLGNGQRDAHESMRNFFRCGILVISSSFIASCKSYGTKTPQRVNPEGPQGDGPQGTKLSC